MNPELKSNAKRLHRNASTWVVTILMGVAYYWLQLPVAEQQALMAAYPWLKHAAPLAGLLSFLGSRVVPQGSQQVDAQDTAPTDGK